MRHRTFRVAAVLAVGVLMASAAIAFADTVPADGRTDTIGIQHTVDLGEARPGQVVTWPVGFQLTCDGTNLALVMDRMPADPARAVALQRLSTKREHGAYAAHAHRLADDLWEILVLPL